MLGKPCFPNIPPPLWCIPATPSLAFRLLLIWREGARAQGPQAGQPGVGRPQGQAHSSPHQGILIDALALQEPKSLGD